MAPLRSSPRAGRRNGTSKPRVRPVRPPQYRGRTSRNIGATLVSPGKPSQRRNWPETSRTPTRTMPRTGRAVPAPGVINGAPTSITAYNAANNAADRSCHSGTGRHKWRPYVHHRAPADATPQDTAAKRRGDTCVARITVAAPQLAGNIAHTAANNAADGACRAGTGRHKWRPYVLHRANNRRNAAEYRRQT